MKVVLKLFNFAQFLLILTKGNWYILIFLIFFCVLIRTLNFIDQDVLIFLIRSTFVVVYTSFIIRVTLFCIIYLLLRLVERPLLYILRVIFEDVVNIEVVEEHS